MHKQRWDVVVLTVGGAGLLALAAVFLWREHQVPNEALLAVAAAAGLGAASVKLPAKLAWLGPWALLLTAVGGTAWFIATKSLLLVPVLAVVLVATAVALARTRTEEKHHRLVLWYSLTIAALTASLAGYFHFFTLHVLADELARRLVLSFVWLLFGLVLVVRAARKQETYGRDAGFLALAVAVGKVLLYDTVSLGGGLRIGLLAGAGVLLAGGGLLVARLSSSSKAVTP